MNRIVHAYKYAYSGLSPATWWLSVVMLINRAGTMVGPFMALYLTEKLHYSIGEAGIVLALWGAGAIFGGVIGGKLTDVFGFFTVQLCSLLSGGVMFILLGQVRSYEMICLFTFLLSVLNDSFRPANATAIAEYSNEQNRTRCFALNRLSINLGWSIGSAVGGFVASHNYNMLFWIDGCTNIGAAILLLVALSPKRNTQTPSRKERAVRNSGAPSPYRDKVYLAFIVFSILFAYCFFQLFSTVPLFYREKLHLSPSFIGMVMSVNGLIIAGVEMALVFKLESRKKNLHFVTLGVLLTTFSFVVFNLLPGAGVLAFTSMLIMTAGEMLSMPFMNTFMITRTVADNRGQYAGLYTVAWSVAQVSGHYTGTLIAEHFGFRALWWFIGGVGILAALGFKWLQIKTENRRGGTVQEVAREMPV